MNLGSQVGALERALQDLIKDWERFFAGILKTPPHEERVALQQRLRRLTEAPGRRSAESFRLEQIQHRFMSYSQMWERMLREKEEGRGRSVGMLRASARPTPAPTRRRPDAPPARSVDQSGAAGLYERFVSAKREVGESTTVKREAFIAQIEAQRSKLEEKFGCDVKFDVVVEGSKVKVAARKSDSNSKRE